MFTFQDGFYSDILLCSKNIENILAFISFLNRCSCNLLSSNSSFEYFKSNIKEGKNRYTSPFLLFSDEYIIFCSVGWFGFSFCFKTKLLLYPTVHLKRVLKCRSDLDI